MPLTEPFDRKSDIYESWFDRNPDYYQAETEALKALFTPVRRKLEVGVGTGRFAIELGIDLGVEPSEAMSRVAMEKGINAIRGTAEELPLYDRSFDMILMVTVVCFVDSLDRALSEAFRITDSGGYVLIGFVPAESYLGRKYETHRSESRFYAEATFYSVPQMKLHMEQAGYENIQIASTLHGQNEPLQLQVVNGNGKGSFVVLRGEKPR